MPHSKLTEHTKGKLKAQQLMEPGANVHDIYSGNERVATIRVFDKGVVDVSRLLAEHDACDDLTDDALLFVPKLEETIKMASDQAQEIQRLDDTIASMRSALEQIASMQEDDNYDDERECVQGCGNEDDVWGAAYDVGSQGGQNKCAKIAQSAITAAIELGER